MNLKPRIKKIEIIIAVLLFATFAILITWSLKSHFSVSRNMATHLITTTDKPDYIEMIANIKSIDPITGDIDLRLTFEPHGNFVNEDYLLTNDIFLYVNNASGEQEMTYSKGKLMYPLDITLNLYDGLVSDYPFDTYKTELYLEIDTIDKRISNLTDDDFTKYYSIGTIVNFTGSVTGYKISANKKDDKGILYTILEIGVSRSGSIKFFSIFIMIAMWCLTILTILLVLAVLTRKRKVEISMFAFASAMLFALPALRNMQPLAPPIGAFPDYVAFFWAESIAALALITLIITWLVRPQK